MGGASRLPCLLCGIYVVIGTLCGAADRVSQEHRQEACFPHRSASAACSRSLVRPLVWAPNSRNRCSSWATPRLRSNQDTRQDDHIEALILAGEEEGIIEKGDRELIQSVVAFGDKTVREVMTPRSIDCRHSPERDA